MRRYYVYVIELASPGPLADVYVGSSALPPKQRFRKHLASAPGGVRGSRHVRRRGVRLLPHLYERKNPFPTRAAAQHEEKRLRHMLERRGHRVFGSCYRRDEDDCLL